MNFSREIEEKKTGKVIEKHLFFTACIISTWNFNSCSDFSLRHRVRSWQEKNAEWVRERMVREKLRRNKGRARQGIFSLNRVADDGPDNKSRESAKLSTWQSHRNSTKAGFFSIFFSFSAAIFDGVRWFVPSQRHTTFFTFSLGFLRLWRRDNDRRVDNEAGN